MSLHRWVVATADVPFHSFPIHCTVGTEDLFKAAVLLPVSPFAVSNLRTTFTAHFATKAELTEVKAELIRWMFIFWLGLIPVIAALIKFVK